MDAPSTPPQRRLTALLAAALLALFWWQAVSASRHWSQTSDELPHLTAGYAYDRFGDFRLHAENGNLPQRVQGLAPLALGAKFPGDAEHWRRSAVWQLGWDFFYGLDNPTDRMLLGARALNALFGVGLGLLIFVAARRAYGDTAALVALAFYGFYPDFLAHAALATSDLAGTLGLTLAAWLFWRHLERRDVVSAALAGLASGAALLAKFNGVLVAPVYALLAAADAWGRGAPGGRGRRLASNFALAASQAGAAIVLIWAAYGFRYAAGAPGLPAVASFPWDWDGMIASLGAKGAVLDAARRAHLLPEAWLYGLTNVLAGENARPAFFAGDYSLQGWRSFFPTLFLTKTPIGMLAGLALALGLAWTGWRGLAAAARRERALAIAPLTVVAAVVGAVALTSHLNIGHRHILAVYPALFVALGGAAAGSRRARPWLLACLLAHAIESAAVRPHYLAFFNRLAGGPAAGYRLFTDSSVDWGQGLPALRTWLQENHRPGEKLYLSYFGSAWAPHYGVRPDVFLPAVNIAAPPFRPYALEPGLYAISATSLSGVYASRQGAWQPDAEAALRRADPATPEFAELRFAKLCAWLRDRRPDAQPGYAILVFRLTAADLDAALGP